MIGRSHSKEPFPHKPAHIHFGPMRVPPSLPNLDSHLRQCNISVGADRAVYAQPDQIGGYRSN